MVTRQANSGHVIVASIDGTRQSRSLRGAVKTALGETATRSTYWLSRCRDSVLARNTWWMFLGNGLKVLIQAAYFIVIARSLGPDQYGAFVGVTALIQILSPFVGVGCGPLMIKNVARDRSVFAEYFGNALFMTCMCGGLFIVGVLAVARAALPNTIPFDAIVYILHRGSRLRQAARLRHVCVLGH